MAKRPESYSHADAISGRINIFQIIGSTICGQSNRWQNALWHNERNPAQSPAILRYPRLWGSGIGGILGTITCGYMAYDYYSGSFSLVSLGAACLGACIGAYIGREIGHQTGDILGRTLRSCVASPILSGYKGIGWTILGTGNLYATATRKLSRTQNNPPPAPRM